MFFFFTKFKNIYTLLFPSHTPHMQTDLKSATDLLNRIRTSLETTSIDDSMKIINDPANQLFIFELCSVAKMFIPTIHQKIDEIIEVGKRKQENPKDEIVVSKHQHGADLIDGGNHTEFKASVISK